jgi:phosphatidylserine synthase
MVSRIPTFSFRNMRFSVSKSKAIFVLIVVSLAVAVLIKETWIFLVALGILYFISIPFSYWAYQKDQMIK